MVPLMTCNDHLITVLDRMHGSQVDQNRWVRDDSGFDNTSKKVMLGLVEGQRACIDRFRDWVGSLDFELPIAMVADEAMPGAWHVHWDGKRMDQMSDADMHMLDAMICILFHGSSRVESNPVLDELQALGLPDRLRQNVSDS